MFRSPKMPRLITRNQYEIKKNDESFGLSSFLFIFANKR